MVDYGERLDAAMRLRTVSTSMLAKEIGVTYQAIKKILDGKSTALSAENNARAAKYLAINSHWLATGEETMLLMDAPSVQPSLAELIKRFSHELQSIKPSSRPFVVHAFEKWAKQPHRWEELVEQLTDLKVNTGFASPDPLKIAAVRKNGEEVIEVTADAMSIARALTALGDSEAAHYIYDELFANLGALKTRFGLWPQGDKPGTLTASPELTK